jgi:hypothetical protein
MDHGVLPHLRIGCANGGGNPKETKNVDERYGYRIYFEADDRLDNQFDS